MDTILISFCFSYCFLHGVEFSFPFVWNNDLVPVHVGQKFGRSVIEIAFRRPSILNKKIGRRVVR